MGLYTQLVTTHASFSWRRQNDAAKATLASFSRHRQNDAAKTTLASFKLVTQNDARLIYTYHGFRHLRLVPRVLRYSIGFYGMAVISLLSYYKFGSTNLCRVCLCPIRFFPYS